MIKYEIRTDNSVIQFNTLKDAQEYNPKEEVFETLENADISIEPTLKDWYNLEKDLYFSDLFMKAFKSEGNGFALLLKMLTNGITVGASQDCLLKAIELLIEDISDFTKEDVNSLNKYLERNNFTITLNNK